MIKKAQYIILIFILLALFSAGICSGFNVPPLQGDEPTGSQWKTIVLGSGDSIRLAPPPNASIRDAEIQELLKLQDQRTPKIVKTVEYWNVGSSGLESTIQAIYLQAMHWA